MNQNQFNKLVKKLSKTKDINGEYLNIHNLTIKVSDQVFSHNFNNFQGMADIRSLSKTVLTLVVGILMDIDKNFNLETKVYPIIKGDLNLENKDNLAYLSKLKVKHLLNHTVGFDQVLMMRNDIKDLDPYKLLDYTLNKDLKYKPGSFYLYSNAGFYILSATLQEYLQEDLINFIDRHLFSKIKIKNYKWESYGKYLAGATRLWLFPEDLLKIGEVLLSQGFYQGQKIVSLDFIEFMKKKTSITKHHHNNNLHYQRYAYGSGLWLNSEDLYFGHGSDGQNLVIIPSQKAIILTLSNQSEVDSLEKIIDGIITSYF